MIALLQIQNSSDGSLAFWTLDVAQVHSAFEIARSSMCQPNHTKCYEHYISQSHSLILHPQAEKGSQPESFCSDLITGLHYRVVSCAVYSTFSILYATSAAASTTIVAYMVSKQNKSTAWNTSSCEDFWHPRPWWMKQKKSRHHPGSMHQMPFRERVLKDPAQGGWLPHLAARSHGLQETQRTAALRPIPK